MWYGSLVALPTPFRDGQLDLEALRRLVDRQIEAGTSGLVPCGTTGEASTLSASEFEAILRAVVEESRGRVPVIAGTGSNSTAAAAARAKRARALGADGALVVVPYYNKPTQPGLHAHFETVARESGLPIMLYDVPSRTGRALEVTTIARLAELPGIVALKDACADLAKTSAVLERVGDRLVVLSGEDGLTWPMMALGARGAVGVTANVAPAEVAKLIAAAESGAMESARRYHFKLKPLSEALFLETNPIPVKAALAALGLIKDELRLPLVSMSDEPRRKLLAHIP